MSEITCHNGVCRLHGPLQLDSGETLRDVDIAYETLGMLNAERSNVVLVCHALTGNANAAEWWKSIIGSNKALDQAKYYVVSMNCIGSCYGSTGPESVNPVTGKKYHSIFPEISIRDIARSILAVLDELGIGSLSLAIGGSFGAMIVFELAIIAPHRVKRIVPISCGVEHTAWRIAFSSVIRKIIEEGVASDCIETSYALARQAAMTSYRSPQEFERRFARNSTDGKFEVVKYLEHHGKKIVERFSPYSYIRLTKAMENFSIFDGKNASRSDILSRLDQPALLIGASSDILYPESELRELADALPNATYKTLEAIWGHDSFLIEDVQLNYFVKQFLESTEDYDDHNAH